MQLEWYVLIIIFWLDRRHGDELMLMMLMCMMYNVGGGC